MTIEIINYTDQIPKIENFSKDRYLSSDYLEKEWQFVWKKNWLLAGLLSDVENTGDYFVFDLGREQILVTKTSTGNIQGFYNVCQHRGNRLMTSERGHAANFRCAYHAWTYDLDGQLKVIPFKERFLDGVPVQDLALKKVRTATWNGFVFVCLSDEPPELLEVLGPIAEILAPYRFDKMTLTEDQTVHMNCNWKAIVDNFSELYHVDFLHPQHKRMVDCCNDTVHLFENGHTGLAVPGATVNSRFPIPDEPTDIQSSHLASIGLDPADFRGRVMEVREAIQKQKRLIGASRGLDYSELTDEQLSDVWQYNLFPNVILSFTPEHLWILRPRPHPTDPQKCEFDKLSLMMFADRQSDISSEDYDGPFRDHIGQVGSLPDDYSRPIHDVFSHQAIISGEKSMADTINQDIELLGGVQEGMGSDGFNRVFLNEDEMRVQHFHNHMNKLMN